MFNLFFNEEIQSCQSASNQHEMARLTTLKSCDLKKKNLFKVLFNSHMFSEGTTSLRLYTIHAQTTTGSKYYVEEIIHDLCMFRGK